MILVAWSALAACVGFVLIVSELAFGVGRIRWWPLLVAGYSFLPALLYALQLRDEFSVWPWRPHVNLVIWLLIGTFSLGRYWHFNMRK